MTRSKKSGSKAASVLKLAVPVQVPIRTAQTQLATDEPAAVWVDIKQLKPWARNPRNNDGEPVRRVAESIQRFGFGAPIIARRATQEIIAGHTRWKAAQSLGLPRVPVRYMDITEEDAHVLALADNRLGELAEWNEPELAALLKSFELDEQLAAGWKQADIDALLASMLNANPTTDSPRLDRLERGEAEGTVCPNCGHVLS